MTSTLEHRSKLIHTLSSVYRKDMGTITDIPALLEQCIAEDAWREFRTERGEIVRYEEGEFSAFLCTPPLRGLGGSVEGFMSVLRAAESSKRQEQLLAAVTDLLTMDPLNGNHRPVGGKVSNAKVSQPDAFYALRRLKRDAPNLAARVIAGELSPHAAAVKAGIRRRYIQVRADDIDRALSKLIEFYTPDEIRGALKRAGR